MLPLALVAALFVFCPLLRCTDQPMALTQAQQKEIRHAVSLIRAFLKQTKQCVQSFLEDEDGVGISELIAHFDQIVTIIEQQILKPTQNALEKQKNGSPYYDFLHVANDLFTEIHRILHEVHTTINNSVRKKLRGKNFAMEIEKKIKSLSKSYEKINNWLASLTEYCIQLKLVELQKHIDGLRNEMHKTVKKSNRKLKTAQKLKLARIIDIKIKK